MSWVENLSNEIVRQAVTDYRGALRGDSLYGLTNVPSEKTIEECEKFFRSEWFCLLTKVDGEVLIEKLKEEYYDECYSRAPNKQSH